MNELKKILGSIRQADSMFNLFQDDDKILVGVSGGKDSLALIYALSFYQKFSFVNFTFEGAILDLGFPNFDPTSLKPFFTSLGVKLHIVDAKSIYPALLAKQKQEKHLPCSLCSKMKKAAINQAAKNLGFHKVAFAHHHEDALETLFMNMTYGGKLATFSPKMFLSNSKIEFIRPFIFVYEKDIKNLVNKEKMPVLPSLCPNDKYTMREKMKRITNEFYTLSKETRLNFMNMLFNYEHADLYFDKIFYKIEGTPLSLKPVLNKEDTFKMISIRQEVFINEQGVKINEEFDGSDTKQKHFLIYYLDEAIGTLRYQEIERHVIKISRIAIVKKHRQKGYGKLALNYIINFIKERKRPVTFIINAQVNAIAFYEKLGFQKEGETFLDANILHIKMTLYKQ
ncbi:MAG: GNAT family N-acetyltransferase [Bacilli bacterium]|jgi:tRNA(Ile)-lysidine synthase TilS/MesJ|nr:GNAT family N-acetyltransferase [Erysipelotrichia bacterium]